MGATSGHGTTERLNEVIKDARKKSIRAFAISIDEDPSYVMKMSKGERPITESVAASIKKTYNINKDWLLNGIGEKYGQDVDKGTTPLPGHATLQDLLNEKDRLIKMAEDHYNDMKSVVEKNLNIIIASLGHNGGILEQVKALVDVNIKQIARQDQALLKASKAAQAQVRGSKRGKAGDGQKAHNL